MGLATNLKGTASVLIPKYGNTVVLSQETNDGVYNPQTGNYGTPVDVSHVKMAYVKDFTTEEAKDLPEGSWGNISKVCTMIQDDETVFLDNKWTIDGLKVQQVMKTKAQNQVIVMKVYVG